MYIFHAVIHLLTLSTKLAVLTWLNVELVRLENVRSGLKSSPGVAVSPQSCGAWAGGKTVPVRTRPLSSADGNGTMSSFDKIQSRCSLIK